MTPDRLRGAASAEGTRRGCESFGDAARELGRTGLRTSPVGFGGYRVQHGDAVHGEALASALRGGVNLIDTSTNYADGDSERLVGAVMADLVQQGALRREQVIVVSKAGYIQGNNLDAVRASEHAYPEIVEYQDHCWHCIHPSFLRDQLELSLERLGLERLDALLLHNPEYYLLDQVRRGRVIDAEVTDTFYDRIRRAFELLEEMVHRGLIAGYGVSSNELVAGDDERTRTSLDRMLSAARAVGGEDHGFGIVQFPMNLYELGAIEHRDNGQSVIDVARAAGLGVLTNRPLNAIVGAGKQQRLVRLAEAPWPGPMADAAAALAVVRKLEATWADGLGRRIVTQDGDDNAVDLFPWGRELTTKLMEIRGTEHFAKLRNDVIAPHLGESSKTLLRELDGDDRVEFAAWWERYGTAMHEAFSAIERGLDQRGRDPAFLAGRKVDAHLPAALRELPLSQKAVLTLLSTPISSVLVGMRRPSYVDDMLALRKYAADLLPLGVGDGSDTGAVDVRALAAEFAR